MENKPVRTWGTADAVWAIVSVLGGIYLMQYLPFPGTALGVSLYLAASYLYMLLVVAVYTLVKYQVRPADLGLKRFKPARALVLAVLWWLAVRAVIIVYALAAARIADYFGAKPPADVSSRIPELFGSGAAGFILAVAVAVVLGPFVEEVFFRGFLYPAFKRTLGVWPAIIVSSAIFGVFHGNPWLVFPTGLMGAAMAYIYEKEGSLGAPFLLHALNNLMSVVIVYTLYVK